MNERIKKLRKTLDLTQQDFADRLGTTRNNIAGYEIGRRSPSVAVISLICREFNVSETWLRTGEGEMFVPAPSRVLDALAAEYNLSHSEYALIEKFLELKPEARRAVIEYMAGIASMFKADDSPAAPAFALTPVEQTKAEKPRKEWTDAELHAELDRQLAEQREAAEKPPAFWRGRSETA